MGLKPEFRISANSVDITAAILANFVSMRITDEAGMQADTLEIVLADDPLAPIAIPPTGAELQVYLGYDGAAQRMGLYVCDELELEGWPAQMTIRGRAAPYEESKGGKSDLQTQKNRSWPKNTKLGDMAAKIAKEHKLKSKVSPSLASIQLPHFDQTEESDIHFLGRVAARYDAFVKPAGGTLVVMKRGDAGLPNIPLLGMNCSSYRVTLARRDSPGTVVAWWHDKRQAKRQKVAVGEGEPTKQLRHSYPTEAAAKAAAQTELDRRKRGEVRLSVSMPGDPSLQPEAQLVTAGFRPGVDGTWWVRKVVHQLDKSGGFTSEVEAERPDDTSDEGS